MIEIFFLSTSTDIVKEEELEHAYTWHVSPLGSVVLFDNLTVASGIIVTCKVTTPLVAAGRLPEAGILALR